MPGAEARDFTLGLKAWNASLSGGTIDGDDDIFDPGIYFSWGITDRFWISAGFIEGEVDFGLRASTTAGSFEETDSDLVVGWSFSKIDIGVGYRVAEFTVNLAGTDPVDTESAGPMIFLGGGDLFGQSRWGYYWSGAVMFEDIEDDDGSQEHFNVEGGFRWSTPKGLSFLFGWRHKEYSGTGSDFTFTGPVANIAYTWNR